MKIEDILNYVKKTSSKRFTIRMSFSDYIELCDNFEKMPFHEKFDLATNLVPNTDQIILTPLGIVQYFIVIDNSIKVPDFVSYQAIEPVDYLNFTGPKDVG